MVQKGGASAAMADIAPPEQEREYPEPSFLGPLPAQGLFVRHAKNVAFRHVKIASIQTDARPFVWLAMSTARTFPVSVCCLVTVYRRCVCTRSAICETPEAEGSLILLRSRHRRPISLRPSLHARLSLGAQRRNHRCWSNVRPYSHAANCL